MNKTYKVIRDSENVYEKGSLITANDIIEKYITHCNDVEDADLIGWIYTLKETNKQEEAVTFITDTWQMDLEEI